MIMKLSNNRSAEYVYMAYKNSDGAGSVTQWTAVNYWGDGNSVTGIDGGNPQNIQSRSLWIGLALKTVAINGFGLAVAWGNATSALLSNQGSSITVTAGDPLIPVLGTGLGLTSVAAAAITYRNLKYATAGNTQTISASAYTSNVQVRAL